MKKLLFLGAFFGLFFTANIILAAPNLTQFQPLENKGLVLFLDSQTQNLRLITTEDAPIKLLKKTSTPLDTGRQFLAEYGKYFGVADSVRELKILKQLKDDKNTSHLIYQQIYNGVPVYGGQLLVHTKNSGVEAANGKYIKLLNSINTAPKISKERAAQLALDYAKNNLRVNEAKIKSNTLYVFNKASLNPKAENKEYLAWEVILNGKNGFNSYTLFIDATNGKIIQKISNNKTITRRVYDCNASNWTAADSCWITNPNDASFKGREENSARVGVADVDLAYNLLESAEAYFRINFGMRGANKKYGTAAPESGEANISTAFARSVLFDDDGKYFCPNAQAGSSGLAFCTSTVNAGTLGHEYMHRVTEYYGPQPALPYTGESGALEEAVSDIFGQAVERSINGFSTWKIGPNVGPIWRDIANPAATPNVAHPDSLQDDKFYCGDNDGWRVHVNSTPISHMVYLLSNGGTLNGCRIMAIGQTKINKILMRAWMLYTPSPATFNQFYDGMRLACASYYGARSNECQQVRAAMQAAFLNQKSRCDEDMVAPTATCALGIKTDVFELANNAKITIPTTTRLIIPKLPPTTNTSTPSQPLPLPTQPLPLPEISTPTTEKQTRNPSFEATLSGTSPSFTVTGKISSFGNAKGCGVPRPFDPVIIAWRGGNGGTSLPKINPDNTFSANYTYPRFTGPIEVRITVHTSCYGSLTKILKP